MQTAAKQRKLPDALKAQLQTLRLNEENKSGEKQK
jgi:hypothetical protein